MATNVEAVTALAPAEALSWLERAVTRSRRRNVQLPLHFIRKRASEQPPLAQLLNLGEVRLKIYLTFKMIATRKPYQLEAPAASTTARMLNLRDPGGAGVRRVQAATRQLVKKEFLLRTPRPGKVPLLAVQTPGEALLPAERRRWVTVPIELWSRGWILVLSGRGLAVYIALRELTGGRPDSSAWMDGPRRLSYDLDDETWRKGSQELERLGLLSTEMEVGRDGFRAARRRKRYQLLNARIEDPPSFEHTRS